MLTLLIDIDNTVVRQTPGLREERGHGLLALIRDQAERRGAPPAAVTRAFDEVFDTVWWTWGDFLDRLGLDRDAFWAHADRVELNRSRPVDLRIRDRLIGLRRLGCRLIITSNNPADGIAHKLRLAGIDGRDQADLFDHLFGTDTIHAVKAEPVYWRRVIQRIGGDPNLMAVIGDDADEDGRVPRHAGIDRWIRIDHAAGSTWSDAERNLRQVMQLLGAGAAG
ncbi:MAG: HAD family hydrolase [Planctomycetota bacterium]